MNPKLMIGIPCSGRFVPPEWAMTMMSLSYPTGTSRTLAFIKGKPRAEARTELIKAAIERGCKYLLFIDDDTCPPPFTIPALVNALDQTDDSVAVCAGIYTNKVEPVAPLVYLERGQGSFWKWKHNEVFECWAIGTGCMLVRLSVLKDIPEPWFRDVGCIDEAGDDPVVIPDPTDPPEGVRMTDDVYFCEKLRQHGFKVLAHGGVLPVHIGQEGNAFVLPNDSYPLKDTNPASLWYYRMLANSGRGR